MKRFYKEVEVVEDDRRFHVALDSRLLRTPAKAPLALPNRGLAAAIAEEWQRQGDKIDSADMELMALACTAIDNVAPKRSQAIAEIASFGEHDLVCYWADNQDRLAARQREIWQPLLDWALLALDARLVVTSGIVSVAQPREALSALAAAVAAHSDMQLAALAAATRTAGSLVIALALAQGRIDAEAAFLASQLDEIYQMELWGRDEEAVARHANLKRELREAARFLELLRG